jgi:hypothetical protein
LQPLRITILCGRQRLSVRIRVHNKSLQKPDNGNHVLFLIHRFPGILSKSISLKTFCVLALLLATAGEPAAFAEKLPASAGNGSVHLQEDGDGASSTKSPDPSPPLLKERNRPALPVVPVPSANSFAQAKPALAWRQKLLKVSLEKYKSPAVDNTADSLKRCYAANYTQTMAALSAACAAAAYKVEYINSNAGEVLAGSNDGRSRLFFSIWEQPQGKTWISAGIDRGDPTATLKSLRLILDTTGNTISPRGKT